MLPRIERVLSEWLASGARGIGQILIVKTDTGFALCHREDEAGVDLEIFCLPNDARLAPRAGRSKGASFGARWILSGPASRARGLGSASA